MARRPREQGQQQEGGCSSSSRSGARRKQSAKACDPSSETPRPSKKRKTGKSSSSSQETRCARFLPNPNSAVKERIARAFSHRLYLIDKNPTPPSECDFFVLGATGNVYTVKLSTFPSCTCPDHARGNICKHILFVMLRVLKLSREDHRVWQKALLPSELHALLENVLVSDVVLASSDVRERFKEIKKESSSVSAAAEPLKDKQREIDSDCPICYEPMASSDGKPSEPVVFCKTCGNNVHADCFQRWSKSKKHGTVTCIYCRAAWGSDGNGGAGEYINLASFSDVHGPEETSLEVLYPESHRWWRRYS